MRAREAQELVVKCLQKNDNLDVYLKEIYKKIKLVASNGACTEYKWAMPIYPTLTRPQREELIEVLEHDGYMVDYQTAVDYREYLVISWKLV